MMQTLYYRINIKKYTYKEKKRKQVTYVTYAQGTVTVMSLPSLRSADSFILLFLPLYTITFENFCLILMFKFNELRVKINNSLREII